MASAYGFELNSSQGVIFALNTNAKRDRKQRFGDWDVELRKDTAFVCAWSRQQNTGVPMEELVIAAHDAAEQLLDIVAVEERTALLCIEPHNNVAWRTSPNGIKVALTSAITFAAGPMEFTAVVTDAAGNVVPIPAYVPPKLHASFRYFRYSQASQNTFEAYRNMFLALESLLDHVAPKQPNEGETAWLARALTEAMSTRGLDLSRFAKPRNTPVQDFLDAHYATIRCAVFHAKASSGQSLRPGSLQDHDTVLHQLLAVQDPVEHLMKKEFTVRLPTSGFSHKGFGQLLGIIAEKTLLIISEGQCPTVEQLLNGDEDEQVDDGTTTVVTFAGPNGNASDEWLFFSEIKPKDLPIQKVKSVRLIARPTDHPLLRGIVDRMNKTLMDTDLDLDGVNKLVINVRCLLRNVQSPKRGFSH
jgi:hypothetical protein